MTTKTISENKSCEMISSRLRGCLYGQAIGDALGLGAEAMTKNEVTKNYPNGLVHYGDIVQDYHRSRWRQGDWADDTDMMLCIADAIIEDNDSKSAFRDSNREDNDNNSEINSSESAPRSLFF